MTAAPQELPAERPPLPELIPPSPGTDPGSGCGYLKVVGGRFDQCKKAGIWHLAGTLDPPSALIVCEDHDRYILGKWAVRDRHPVSARCLLADTRWYPSWASPRGCDVPMDMTLRVLPAGKEETT